jgi:hypothetical protein
MNKFKPYLGTLFLYSQAVLALVHPGFTISPVVQAIIVPLALALGAVFHLNIARLELALVRVVAAAQAAEKGDVADEPGN